MFDYQGRRRRLHERMEKAGVDVVFLPPSADLEYFTGMERRVPTFGEVAYTSHWVAGAFLAPGKEPVFVLPRMIREFDLPNGVEGDVITVAETDDADALFRKAAGQFGNVRRLAVGNRAWAESVVHLLDVFGSPELVSVEPIANALRRVKEADELEKLTRACRIVDDVMKAIEPKVVLGVTELEVATEVAYQMKLAGSRAESFDTAVWGMGPLDQRDATVRISQQPLRAGSGISFDFGAVVDGYCSDFGRTVHIGQPNDEYVRVHELVMAAQAAGLAATRPGATAQEVHEATRKVIVDGGYGEWFRHRTGHCIGMDVHEHPYISEEDETPLEVGMTFTIEPSVFWPGHVGVRVEDIVVVEESGGRMLNEHPTTMVVND